MFLDMFPMKRGHTYDPPFPWKQRGQQNWAITKVAGYRSDRALVEIAP